MQQTTLTRYLEDIDSVNIKPLDNELKYFKELDFIRKKQNCDIIYSQDWTAYNKTQTSEFAMFQNVLIEILDSLIETKSPYRQGRPFNDFKDEDGLINEADLARKLGFDGKFVIHPSQIETVARIFCPTEDEVAHATRVLTAFEEASAKGFASASMDGNMIDIPIAQRALKVILSAKNMLHRGK